MVNLTPGAAGKLREMQNEHPERSAFRVVFRGFG